MITFLPFTVCFFWLIFLLLEWKRVSNAVHFLTLFAAVSTTLYLCHAIYFYNVSRISAYATTVYSFCNIAVFPIYYLYICRLTQVGKITRRQWLVLLPALIIGLWTGIDLFVFPHAEMVELWRQGISKVIFVVQLIVVIYYSWKKIDAFDRKIMDFYSDTENRVANMTSYILLILAICSFVSVIFTYIGREHFVGNVLLLSIPSGIFSVCLYAVCYIGYRQSFTADDFAKDEITPHSEQIPIPEPESIGETLSFTEFSRICSKIEENQLFLKSDLRLPELANLVGIGRTRLSILINEQSGNSFSDFINKYRIEYACRLLKEDSSNKEIVIADISVQCGFMSDSSFYRSFKKFTGMSPAKYRETQFISPENP